MKKIKMYTLSTCLWCKRTKKFFEERGIAYDCTDYDKADEAEQARIAAEMKANGYEVSFPYVCIGGEIIQGYQPEEFEKLLGGKK